MMNLRNDAYWQERAESRLALSEMTSEQYLQEIAALHKTAFEAILEDMQRIFGTYAIIHGLTKEEAEDILTLKQSEDIRQVLRSRLERESDLRIRQKILSILNAPAYAYRISRLQALQLLSRETLLRMAPEEVKVVERCLSHTAEETFFRTLYDLQVGTGLHFEFSALTEEYIKAVIWTKRYGRNFSDRVWENTEAVAEKTDEIIARNIMSGRSWRRAVGELSSFIQDPSGGARFCSERLLRTETNHIHNEITAETHVSVGFEKYRFLATLDNRTSEMCQEHDGFIDPDTHEEYTYKNRKNGKNYPPLHPFCRSTACGRFDSEIEAKMMRSARDPVTGKIYTVPYNMTFPEWVKTLTDEQRDMLKYWKEK